MPIGISQNSGVLQGLPGLNKPAVEVFASANTEGHCPTGDLGCPGLTAGEDGKLHCGLEGNSDSTYQVAACYGRRQETR